MENTEEIYTDFARVYDELMDNTPYEMWCNRLDQLIASYGVSRPTRDAEGILDSERNLVVDLGCGTGTLTELLYQKGYDCIGVDNSEEMLGIAMRKRWRAVRRSSICIRICRNWICILLLVRVISVCDSVNYILEEEELLQVFRLVNNYLYPGGFLSLILIQIINTGKSSAIRRLRRTGRIAVLSGKIIMIRKKRSTSMI